jgi:micrococcal nuclease
MRRLILPIVLALLLATATPVEAAGLSVRFVSLPSAYRGSYATATVATKAGARCTIVVMYKSGSSKAKGLGAKTVAGNGRVAWTWKVGTNTTRGSWPVTVTCKKGSASGKATKNLVVR